MRWPLFLSLLTALALGAVGARAAEVIPPAPAAHFNDYAGLVQPGTAQALDAQLDQFERSTSNQILVVIYPHMQSDSSIEDYTVRVAQSWHAGLKGRDNGAVLFIFAQDHTAYIQVGYGLEPDLTDATCKEIIENEIVPRFRQGDYDGGLQAAVTAMLAATRGEYKGTGRTVGDSQGGGFPWSGLIFFLVLIFLSFLRSRQHTIYGGSGRGSFWGGMLLGSMLGGGSRGGFGGGGGGFGGGGFSGGGGGFGGGGAGGSW